MYELRREFLLRSFGLPALWSGARPGLKVDSVRAYPINLRAGSQPEPGSREPRFSSDFDPARWRFRGPFSLLASSIVVEIKTDQGIVGLGLAGGGAAAAYIIEHHLKDLLLGVDPLNIELLWDQLYQSSSYYGRRGVVIMALSGIDLALWDIAGKHAGKPVYQLLGGATKQRAPAYFTGNNVETGLKLGCNTFKLSIRDGTAEGRDGMKRTVEQVTRARNDIGPDRELMIDCNNFWDVPYTLEMARRLAAHRLYWIEEPISPDDIDGYEVLCREIRNTRIASGNFEYTRWGFRELIRHKAVHVLLPDMSWAGGLTELRRIDAMAGAQGLPVVPHRSGSLYGLAFALASPNCPFVESFGIGEPGNEILRAMTPRFESGYYYASDKPGFGVEIPESDLRRYTRG